MSNPHGASRAALDKAATVAGETITPYDAWNYLTPEELAQEMGNAMHDPALRVEDRSVNAGWMLDVTRSALIASGAGPDMVGDVLAGVRSRLANAL